MSHVMRSINVRYLLTYLLTYLLCAQITGDLFAIAKFFVA